MYRRRAYVLSLALLLALVALGLLLSGGQPSQAGPAILSAQDKGSALPPLKPEVSMSVKNDTSPPLRDLAARQGPITPSNTTTEIPEGFPTDKPAKDNGYAGDGALQLDFGLLTPLIPSPVITFSTIPNLCGCSPPDPNGDVGPNHYIAMFNLHYQIFNKSGTSLLGPLANNTLWAGFGGPCQTENAGDPIVLHDQMADRWLLSQFTDTSGPFFNCVAISTTSDPTGSYHRYAFSAPTFPDYPKYGVWPDAYYFNTRESGGGVLGNYAVERAQMLVGNPAQVVRFAIPELAYRTGLLPSDLDGSTLPPAGAPNYFVGTQDDGFGAPSGDDVSLYKFHVDWVTPANSTFTGPTLLDVAAYDSNFPCAPGSRDCIPQPGTSAKIDILSYRQRPTFRLAYRNYGTHESLVTAQSVEAQPGIAGMRWYELRDPNGTPAIFQQGTYSPDNIHRWMGSIAMDGSGNMALGYSVSDATSVFPGVRYTGRLAGDPPGQMPQGEGIIINGTGSQTGSQRWGDYTSMNVDPTDDCTFWYTNEYVPTTSGVGWRGVVGAFRFPGCGGTPTPTATGTPPTSTPTPTRTNTPIVSPTVCVANYTVTASTGATIVAGTTFLSGSSCDDCSVALPLPFSFSFYGQSYNSVNVISNGNLQFSSTDTTWTNTCEPAPIHDNVVHVYWDDLLLTTAGDGVYTSVSGSAPNRIQNIEWRGCYYNGGVCGGPVNIEARLYEGSGRIDVIYGTAGNGNASATGGVQRGTGSLFLQAYCNGVGMPVSAGTMHMYLQGSCGSVTPSPIAPTNTPGGATPTPCAGGGPIIQQGSLSPSDPDQTGRLFRDDPGSDCAAPTTCATFDTTPRDYDSYTYTNTSGSSVCVTVDVLNNCGVGTSLQSAAYLGSFNPASLCTNYLADIGATPNDGFNKMYSFTVPAGQSFVVTVNEAGTLACASYTLTITGLPGGACPSPTTAPPTATQPSGGTPSATPTCAPSAGGWSAGQSLPVPNVRAFGAYFPTNGRFYAMGGRSADAAGNAQLNPLEYNPATNTWITKTAVFSDQQTSNVQGGVVTMGGTPVIIVVGGSAGGGTGGTNETRVYNPVADTMVTLTTDPWPPGLTTVPGGSAVVANKLYIFGGFVINTAMSDEIWEFDPNGAAGSRWTLKGASLPAGRGYIPTVAIGGMIYMAGGSDWDGTTIFDSDQSVSYNPATDTIGTIATIPRLTAETRAVNMAGKMWVLGGGRDAPNPNNQVDIYDPGTNTWSVGTPFVTARRNFPTDTDGAGKIYLAGGYAPTAPDMSMEIYSSGTPCPTATPGGPTNTPVPPTATNTTGPGITNTPTNTPEVTVTPTHCALEFTDVPPGHTFYTWIRCLACQGIINGYPCGGQGEPCDQDNNPYFRPGNFVTRGQLSKIVAISAGYNNPVSGQTFEDVLPGTAFYTYTEQLAGDGVIGGYPCGQVDSEPCIPPDNRPYFRPGNSTTRGQLTKIVALAAGFNDPAPNTFTFTDVPVGHTFHIYVEALLLNRPGVMEGYPCGGPGEPCDDQNRPYFRPNNTLTRGQASKIVANTFFPGCNPPLDANPAESYLLR